MATPRNASEELNELIADHMEMLSSPDLALQQLGHRSFVKAVEEQSRDLSSKSFAELVKQLDDQGQRLLQGEGTTTLRQKTAGLNVLDCLLEVNDEDRLKRQSQFGGHLKMITAALEARTAVYDVPFISCACRALGHWATLASTTDSAFIENYFHKPCKEWIKHREELLRVTAVLILKVLLASAPALFIKKDKNEETFNQIWDAIYDSKPSIREKAVETLGSFLMFVHQREAQAEAQNSKHTTYMRDVDGGGNLTVYQKCLKQTESKLSLPNKEDAIHGSLLALAQLLKHPKDLLETGVHLSGNDAALANKAAELHDEMAKVFDKFTKTIIDTQRFYSKLTAKFVQTAVIQLLPRLAAFDIGSFVDISVGASVYFLLDCIATRSPNYEVAFKSVGDLCIIIGKSIPDSLFTTISDTIIKAFTEGHGGKQEPMSSEGMNAALSALGMIVTVATNSTSSDEDLTKGRASVLVTGVNSLLMTQKNDPSGVDVLFKGGLSATLIHTVNIIQSSPIFESWGARARIQTALFKEVNKILEAHTRVMGVDLSERFLSSGRQATRSHSVVASTAATSFFGYKPAGAVGDLSAMLQSALKAGMGSAAQPESSLSAAAEIQLVILALQTLHSFDFYTKRPAAPNQVLKAVREHVMYFLDDEEPSIRKVATETCCKVLAKILDDRSFLQAKRLNTQSSSSNTDTTVLDVIDRLLMVGVADEHAFIRAAVFTSLTPRLDPFVAQSEHISCLLDAINDDDVQVCSAAMTVIARLAYHSPTAIMPELRKVIVKLVRQLEQNEDSRFKENSVVLLTELIRGANTSSSTNNLLLPYVETILDPLLGQLDLLEVDAAAIVAIGELSLVSSACVAPHINILLTKIVELLDDKGALRKQEMALKALGQIVGSTGCVITAYVSHPELLSAIINIIQRDDNVSHDLRFEATRAFGILGVVDPSKLGEMRRKMIDATPSSKQQRTVLVASTSLTATSVSSTSLAAQRAERTHPVAFGRSSSTAGGGLDYGEGDRASELDALFGAQASVVEETLASAEDRSRLDGNHHHHHHHHHHHQTHGSHRSSSYGRQSSWAQTRPHSASIAAPFPNHHLSEVAPSPRAIGVNTNNASHPVQSKVSPLLKLEDYYPAITISALVNILRDPMLKSQHDSSVRIAQEICKKNLSSSKSAPLVEDLVMCCIDGICEEDDDDDGEGGQEKPLKEEKLFELLGLVIDSVGGEQIEPFLPRIIDAFEQWYEVERKQKEGYWLKQVLKLIGGDSKSEPPRLGLLGVLKPEAFKAIVPDLLPSILSVILDFESDQDQPRVEAALNMVGKIGPKLGEHVSNVVHVLLRIIDRHDAKTSLRRKSFLLLLYTTKSCSDVSQYASRIIHASLRLICRAGIDSDLQSDAMQGLCCMVCRLGAKFVPYVLPVKTALQKAQYNNEEYSHLYHSLVMKAVKDVAIPAEDDLKPTLFADRIPADWHHRKAAKNDADSIEPDAAINEAGLIALKASWDVQGRTTPGDWVEWMRRFSLELLKQSPSRIIRNCSSLAESYPPLATELLNASFMSVWNSVELSPDDVPLYDLRPEAVELAKAITGTIEGTNVPQNILHEMLNLIEFVELHDKRLPVDIIKMGNQCRKAHALAKCLRCKEIEFGIRPGPVCIEALIALNNELGLDDAAKGILKYVTKHLNEIKKHHPDIKVMPSWQEKLGNWNEALDLYRLQAEEVRGEPDEQASSPMSGGGGATRSSRTGTLAVAPIAQKVTNSKEAQIKYDKLKNEVTCKIGEMRCESALDDHNDVLSHSIQAKDLIKELVHTIKKDFKEEERQKSEVVDLLAGFEAEIGVLGAKAAWSLGQWEDLRKCVDGDNSRLIENSDPDDVASLFGAIVALDEVHGDLQKAQNCIDAARSKIMPMLASMLGDFSYSRAHRCMITVQQLSELEEIIQFKKLQQMIEKSESRDCEAQKKASREQLKAKWDRRLAWVPQDADLWRQILNVRSLVLNPLDDLDAWLKYEKICRRSCKLSLCHSALRRLGVEEVILNLDSSFSESSRSRGGSLQSTQSSRSMTIERASLVESMLDRTSLLGLNPMHSPLARSKKASISKETSIENPNGSVSDQMWSPTRIVLSEVKSQTSPRVMYSIFKYMWSREHRHDALKGLQDFCSELKQQYTQLTQPHESSSGASLLRRDSSSAMNLQEQETRQLLGRCMLKVAKWKEIIQTKEDKSISYDEIIAMQKEAAVLRPNYYKAWHSWALTNYKVIQSSSGIGKPKKGDVHVVNAAIGFFRSLDLARNRPIADVLQDTLRLLTVWFNNGDDSELNKQMEMGLKTVSVDTWLFVIPQLIARIHTRYQRVNELLHDLLTRVGQEHPQALIYPVTVASNGGLTGSQSRVEAAHSIVEKMKTQDGALVEQAMTVSQEMIQLAITWHEAWHEGLEEASRLFFSEGDTAGTIRILEALHEELDPAPKKRTSGFDAPSKNKKLLTLRKVSFLHSYGRDIEEASEWLKLFKASQRLSDLHQAWDLYYVIFRKIAKQLNNISKIQLQHVSPKLLAQKNLKLAVPGTYKAHADVVRIQSFAPSIDVIVSKQRPRKMTIMGSDGRDYTFLLKGHEDLRQDERVMQLFGLINALLAQDDRSSKIRNAMSIRTYSVMPLPGNSGVIGWVPECDTLHSLVKQYRDEKNIKINCESRLIQQLCTNDSRENPDSPAVNYDALPLLKKVQIFDMVRNETKGEDLAKMLFLKSQNSEVWLARRTNYTRSVAITSIAGYILGLGDRHPNNLMIDRLSGKVVHIDFGDCWEVCQTRSKFPESVPFRLTRMMIKAMEVSGIEGSFRSDCETVMRILRENRDSLTAMLEAFVHDPLISWRLLTEGKGEKFEKDDKKGVVPSLPNEGADDEDDEDDDDVVAANAGGEGKVDAEKGSSDDDESADAVAPLEEAKDKKKVDGPKNATRRPSTFQLLGFNAFAGPAAIVGKEEDENAGDEEINDKAMQVKKRIEEKLTGNDFKGDKRTTWGVGGEFKGDKSLDVSRQVDKLIKSATSVEHLCVLFQGWCSWW